jgi:hypothetical protein
MTFSQWLLFGGIAALGLIIAGLILFGRLKKRDPEGAAKVQAAVGTVAVAAGQDVGAALHRLASILEERLPGPTLTVTMPDAPAAAEHEVLPISGKLGQAGPLTVQCVGEPRADQAAFNEKYFG